MSHHIKKEKNIQGRVETIYYQGELRWTTVFEDRKVYESEGDATAALYHFGGDVVSE
jgi:hypothetical protein